MLILDLIRPLPPSTTFLPVASEITLPCHSVNTASFDDAASFDVASFDDVPRRSVTLLRFRAISPLTATVWPPLTMFLSLASFDDVPYSLRRVNYFIQAGCKEQSTSFRYLNKLKTVKNKTRPEGSICEAYLIYETTQFCSYYFDTELQSTRNTVPQNLDNPDICPSTNSISVFNGCGEAVGACTGRYLIDKEVRVASLFQTKSWCESRKIENCGVCVKGNNHIGDYYEYYGVLREVLQLEYPGEGNNLYLFNCD
ncbi:hypothetical protein M5K25_002102 [Dendrobium thyrsiflorum]|uniref:DUF4218 domain-containing protein n=1 Tax=Dendrobium thyrsiflorum TaxID=117978 RepID=A0ABD0W159_DENTH